MNRTAIAALATVLALAACGGEPTPDPADQVVGGFGAGDIGGNGEPVDDFTPRTLEVTITNSTERAIRLSDDVGVGAIPDDDRRYGLTVEAGGSTTYVLTEDRAVEDRQSARPNPRIFCHHPLIGNDSMVWYLYPEDPVERVGLNLTLSGISEGPLTVIGSLPVSCPESMPHGMSITFTPGSWEFEINAHLEWVD